ncbi:proteoglycan 4b [Chanos chanos]|uniref:Proteoglycan 4b n=1 Tax=Chanos chanos TaxID=29144 RepID=A0A6J2V7V7_CHACN|nr:proteoglycan 4 [Chanos chanos]
MSRLLALSSLLLLMCVLFTNSAAQLSCSGRCGESYYRGHMCHCDHSCLSHDECCQDYESQCTTSGSCKGRCGEPFKRGRDCDCDEECDKFKKCCPDYKSFCSTEDDPQLSNDPEDVTPKPEQISDQNEGTGEGSTDATPAPDETSGTEATSSVTPEEDAPITADVQPTPLPDLDGQSPSVIPEQDPNTGADSSADPPSELTETGETPETDTQGDFEAAGTGGFTPSLEDLATPTMPTLAPSELGSTAPNSSESTSQPPSETGGTGTPEDLKTVSPTPFEPEQPDVATSIPVTLEVSDQAPTETAPTQNGQDSVSDPDTENPEALPKGTSPSPELTVSVAMTTTSPDSVQTTNPTNAPAEIDQESQDPNSSTPKPEEQGTEAPPIAKGEDGSQKEQDGSDDIPGPEKPTEPAEKDSGAPKNLTTTPAPQKVPPAAIKPPQKPTKPSSPTDPKKPQVTENPRDYQGDDSNDTNLCSGRPVNGLTTLGNGTVVVFRGHYFWTLDSNRVPSPARSIAEVWGIPSPIDTVYTRCNCQGKTFFFKGNQYWRFENDVMDPGYPKLIRVGFDGLSGHITAALSMPEHRGKKESVFFFKRGGRVQRYTYQMRPTCPKTTKITVIPVRRRQYRQAVPSLGKEINIRVSWKGFPYPVTSALSVPTRGGDGYSYYVFSRSKHYSVKMDGDKPTVVTPTSNTQQKDSGKSFFKCPDVQKA